MDSYLKQILKVWYFSCEVWNNYWKFGIFLVRLSSPQSPWSIPIWLVGKNNLPPLCQRFDSFVTCGSYCWCILVTWVIDINKLKSKSLISFIHYCHHGLGHFIACSSCKCRIFGHWNITVRFLLNWKFIFLSCGLYVSDEHVDFVITKSCCQLAWHYYLLQFGGKGHKRILRYKECDVLLSIRDVSARQVTLVLLGTYHGNDMKINGWTIKELFICDQCWLWPWWVYIYFLPFLWLVCMHACIFLDLGHLSCTD